MAKRKFWLGMLVMVLAFGMTTTGCDTGGGEQQPPTPTPLQQAINWANEDARRWQQANGGGQVAFNDPHSNDMIRDPQITFIQFVEDALTNAWNDIYRYNPSAWNAAKWKEVINGAFSRWVWDEDTGTWTLYPYPYNHYFDGANELPLVIS